MHLHIDLIIKKLVSNKSIHGPIILIGVCLLAFLIRIQSINKMGRAMDEDYILEKGYKFFEMTRSADFANSYWWKIPDHPPLGNYIYGISAKLDVIGFDSHKEAMDRGYYGVAQFAYNLSYSRLTAILFSILTIYIVTFISYKYFGALTAISSGIILSTIPFFVALGQNANLDIIFCFFFTATVSFTLLYLEKPTYRKAILIGFLLGCTLLTKQTGIIVYPLIFAIFGLKQFFLRRIQWFELKGLALIVITSLITNFVLWPMPFFHMTEYVNFTKSMWLQSGGYPEWFLGHLRITPPFYYFVYILVTIPLLMLLFIVYGGIKMLTSKRLLLFQILVWLCIPLILQSLYKGRQHQLRYVIEIYAPLAIIGGYGFSTIIKRLRFSLKKSVVAIVILATYGIITLARISPYYFDYFSEVVGGTNTVYKSKIFQMGFGGEGLGEATDYLAHNAKKYSTVAVCADPFKNVNYNAPFRFLPCDQRNSADFIIVNYYFVIRDGFDETTIGKNYKYMHTVYADKAELVHVYKK